MPSYTYKCTVCGHRFDGVAKMSEPCPPCPAAPAWSSAKVASGGVTCGSPTEKVIVAGAAVHFAGGGWAADGYSKGRA